jgi:hypothetical protein
MSKICKNGHISPRLTLLFFELHQHNIPQKNTFFIYNCCLQNRNVVKSEKFEESQFFPLCHVGALCTKTLTLVKTIPKRGPILKILTFFSISFS